MLYKHPSLFLKLSLFPCLARAQIMADKIKLVAVAAKACVFIPLVLRYAFHFGLHHCAVVVVFAV